jgi:hypothetical protein
MYRWTALSAPLASPTRIVKSLSIMVSNPALHIRVEARQPSRPGDQDLRHGESGLWRWPLLRAMQDPQDLHVIRMHFVHGDERKGDKHELAGAFDASWASPVRKRDKCRDALDYGLRHSSRGIWTAFRDVVTHPFEIVSRVRRPADAHQPR